MVCKNKDDVEKALEGVKYFVNKEKFNKPYIYLKGSTDDVKIFFFGNGDISHCLWSGKDMMGEKVHTFDTNGVEKWFHSSDDEDKALYGTDENGKANDTAGRVTSLEIELTKDGDSLRVGNTLHFSSHYTRSSTSLRFNNPKYSEECSFILKNVEIGVKDYER